MKKSIGKAAELVRNAVGALRGKAGVLRARLLFLASSRRRAAVFARISRHIRALTPRQLGQDKKAAAAAAAQYYYCCRDSSKPLAAPAADVDKLGVVAPVGLTHHQLPTSLLVQEVDGDSHGGYTADDWTLALRSLFDDDNGDGHRSGGDADGLAAAMDGLHDDADGDDDDTSVIDVIRKLREGDGQEFRIEDEIDRAADMYITRVRRRLSAQLELPDEQLATGASGY